MKSDILGLMKLKLNPWLLMVLIFLFILGIVSIIVLSSIRTQIQYAPASNQIRVGTRLLVEDEIIPKGDHRYITIVKEVKVLEISEGNKYIKLVDENGVRSWREYKPMMVIEVLKD